MPPGARGVDSITACPRPDRGNSVVVMRPVQGSFGPHHTCRETAEELIAAWRAAIEDAEHDQ